MDNQIQLTPENIQQVLAEQSADKLVLMTFFSAQQPECIEQANILSELAQSYKEHLLIATVDCDTQQALASQLAQQVGLQALPTIVLLKNGAPAGVLPGPKSDAEIKEALAEHLPSPEVLLLEQAKQALANDDQNAAFNYAKQAYAIDPENTRVKLVLADICIQIQKFEDSKALLDSVVETERDPYYQNLQAKLNAAQSAQESPEIIALTEQLDADPENKDLKTQLAALLAEAGKKEQALELLLSVLRKDLNFGTAKKDYLDLIASLPDGDALAGAYRRKLYSLLY